MEVDVDTTQYESGHIPGAVSFNWQTQLQDQTNRDIISRESLEVEDVLIVTEQIDVEGDSARRLPGLIRVAAGEFSPCSRCDQQVEDFGFSAARLELYPGDRLVAFDVTVLIRERPAFDLPLLVLPLGPEERRPRLHYQTGTSVERALIELTWPYVAGPDAYGDLTLRYMADVDPGGSPLGDALLGGSVRRSYFGVRLDHDFYTARGTGDLVVDFTPGLEEAEGWEPPKWTVRFAYADDELLGPPRTEVLLARDDASRPFIWEASLRARRAEGPRVALQQGADAGERVAAPVGEVFDDGVDEVRGGGFGAAFCFWRGAFGFFLRGC